jgi:hypothetical protein
VHDYFDLLGLPNNAPASEVRRAHARRRHRTHPDFATGQAAAPDPAGPAGAPLASAADASIDFADMTAFLDRMQAAFFRALS